MAHAIFVKSTGDGDAATFAAHSDWRDTWQIVVPVDLDRERSGIVLYDRFNGEAKFGSIDSSGAVKELAVWGWADAWDIIVAGNFSSKTTQDLLLYRRDTGEAKFLTTTKQGEYETLTHHEDWNTVWDIIVPGKFGGSKYTDLLLYERNTGIAKFLTTDGTGHVDVLKRHDWQSDWDIIIPGNFSSSEYTDLLFYRRSDGVAKFFKTDGAGEIIELAQHDWQANWDFIVPGNFSSSEFTDLLFYRREDGLAKFYQTDGAGDVTKMTEQTWGRVYDAVVAGDFVDGKHDDVLLYASRLNKAVGVGWRGSVDTDLQFSEFFTGDHTVMARFMLQYPIGYAGPVCAENGAGTYFIGQGNYSEGGSGAKLRIEIGSQLKTISVSDTIDGQWVHVAVVRSGNTFKVYLDGQHQSPDVTISSSDSALPTPTSTLRLGRRTDGETVDDREAQFYGLIDEVAVFARALTQAEIDDLAASDKQLEGTESDLVAAWTFGSSNASGSELPAALSRPYVLQSHPGAAGRAADVVTLSPARSNKYDRKLLPRPPILLKFPCRSPRARSGAWFRE